MPTEAAWEKLRAMVQEWHTTCAGASDGYYVGLEHAYERVLERMTELEEEEQE